MAKLDKSTILYLRGDSFEDYSLYGNREVTNVNATIVEDDTYGKCIELVGNQYIQVVNGMQGIDYSKDFTIEWWEYSLGTATTSSSLLTNRIKVGTESTAFMMCHNDNLIYMGNTTSWNGFNGATMKNKILNEWVHWRLVKKDTTWTSYRNGVKFWSATSAIVAGKTDGDNCTIGAWVNVSKIISGYNARIRDFRIVNYALCDGDFECELGHYNSIDINIVKRTPSKIDFNISKFGKEVINKVEVLVNHNLSETYTNNFGNVNYTIDKSLCNKGENNKITIRVTFDGVYTEELEIVHYETFDELPMTSNLREIMDRQEQVIEDINTHKNILRDILIKKKIDVDEDEETLSILIDKVNGLGENPNINNLYLFEEGNEYKDVTGGWDVWYKTQPYYTLTKDQELSLNVTTGKAQVTHSKFIDFSKYSKLYIDAHAVNTLDYNIYYLGVIPSTTSPLDGETPIVAHMVEKEEKGARKVYEIDLTEINVYGYIGLFAQCNSGRTIFNIYNIWLEK